VPRDEKPPTPPKLELGDRKELERKLLLSLLLGPPASRRPRASLHARRRGRF